MSMPSQAWLNLLLTQANKQKSPLDQVATSVDPSLDNTTNLMKYMNGPSTQPQAAPNSMQQITNPMASMPALNPNNIPQLTGNPKMVKTSESSSRPIAEQALTDATDSLGPVLYGVNTDFPTQLSESNSSIKALRDLAQNYPTAEKQNLSGLMDFANYATNGKYHSTYKQPESVEDLLKNKGTLLALASKANEGTLGEEGKLILGEIAAKIQKAGSLAVASEDQKKDQENRAKFLQEAAQNYESSSTLKSIRDSLSMAQTVQSGVEKNEPGTVSKMGSLIQKLKGDTGNIGENEAYLNTRFGSAGQKFKQFMADMWTGKYTDWTKAQQLDFVNTVIQAHNEELGKLRSEKANEIAGTGYPGIGFNEAYKVLGSGSTLARPRAVNLTPDTTGGSPQMTLEQELQYRRSLEKKKVK